MKKYLLFILLLPGILLADEHRIQDLSGGIYSNASANKIPDNSAAFIQNFLTDIEPIVVERNGYVRRDNTILGGTKTVTGLWEFVDPSGNSWIISYSSRTYYKNTIGQTPTAFGPITTVDQIPDCANNLGKFWCVNGTDAGWYFDGTATATVSGMPLGTLIEPWRTRLIVSNISGAKSTVRVSADGDGTTWTIGGLSTDPFSFQVGGANDGSYVRCLTIYQDSIIVGRKYDLWAGDGFDQSDFTLRNISNQIGCIEPRTVKEVDGELVFLSARGLEAMSARSIRNISEPIRDVIDIIVKNTVNQRSNTQTEQSDWAAGTVDNVMYLDTHTVAGNIQLTFPDEFTSYRDGTSGTKPVWDSYCKRVDFGAPCVDDLTATDGNLIFVSDGGKSEDQFMRSLGQTPQYAMGTTFYISISSITPATTNLSDYLIGFSSISSESRISSLNNYFYFQFQSTGSSKIGLNLVRTSSDLNLCSGSSCQAVDSTVPANIAIYVSTTNYRVTINNSLIKTGSHTFPNYPLYIYHDYFYGVAGSSGSAYLDMFGVTPESGTFTSQLINIGSLISSWGPTTISDVKTAGSTAYQFGSTSTANLSSIANYTTILNGGVPTISTNPYAAFKALFSNYYATSSVKLSEYITTWNEGGTIPSPVSDVYDRRYWISFTTATTSSPLLDSIYVWQRNKSFTFFKGINASSFATWRDYFYFGNSNNTGYVYKYDIGNNDDGENINSFLKTKSYDFGNFLKPKEFSKAYLSFLGGDGEFSLTYNLNRFGTEYTMGDADMAEEESIGQILAKFWFPIDQLVRAREVQYTLTKSGTDSRLRLYDLATQYELKEEK